jgi:ADP-heptose:LPS heptosyltransferase
MTKRAGSILVIDMSPFGASLVLLPATRALRSEYPKALLVAATSTGACELLSTAGDVDDTIDLGVIKSSEGKYLRVVRRLAALIRRSRRYNFDLVLNFSPRLETEIASRLILRAPTITGSRLPRTIEMLLDLVGVPRSSDRAGLAKYKKVLRRAGAEMTDTALRITLPDEEHARFEERLIKAGSRGGELIVVIYASNPRDSRGWPVEAFADTSRRLANNFGARVIAADEPSDRAFTDALDLLLPAGPIKLTEPRSVELVAAIARASIVITDEPAIAQIASELQTPVIEVAETTSRESVSPSNHRVIDASVRKRVTVEQVYEKACEIIQENRSPSLFQRP